MQELIQYRLYSANKTFGCGAKMDIFRHRGMLFLIVMMLAFTVVFFLAYSFNRMQKPLISIGLDAETVNWVVMLMSVIAIARTVVLIRGVDVLASDSN